MSVETAPISVPVSAAVETVGSTFSSSISTPSPIFESFPGALPVSFETFQASRVESVSKLDFSAMVPHELSTIHVDRALPDPRLAFNDKLFRTEVTAPIGDPVALPNSLPETFSFIGPTMEQIIQLEKKADRQLLSQSMDFVQSVEVPDEVRTHFERIFGEIAQAKGLDEETEESSLSSVKVKQEIPDFVVPQTEEEAEPKVHELSLQAQPQPAVESKLNVAAVALPITQPQTSGMGEPPTNISIGQEMEEPQEPQEPLEPIEFEEPVYERTSNRKVEKFAKDVQKRRLEVAGEIVERASQTEEPRISVEGEIYKLDIPSLDETTEILTGQLTRPTVAHKAYIGLSVVKDDDIKGAEKAIKDAVNSAKPTKKETETHLEGQFKLRALEKGARQIALDGAKKFVFKSKKGWEEVKKLPRKHVVEYELVEEKKAA